MAKTFCERGSKVTVTSCISDRYILHGINDKFDKGTAMHKKATWNVIKQKTKNKYQGENATLSHSFVNTGHTL
jgi:hypothetical protein